MWQHATHQLYLTCDMLNRPLQQQYTVPGAGGGVFRFDTTYTTLGARATLRYPGGNAGQQGELVTFGYNAVGQLTSVTGDDDTQYVASTAYNAQGQVIEQRFDSGANGFTRQSLYNANTLRLETLKAGKATPYEELQKLTYTYDLAGNVQTLTDATNSGQVQTFGYDWLDRLTSAATNSVGVGQYNHTYQYNAIGNIISYNGNAYTYGTKPHAVTAAFGNSYGYDAVGNQTSRTISGIAYTPTFDYDNRLTGVAGGSVNASFLYDADGNRVKGTVGGVTTVYLAGLYEWQNGAVTKYYEGGAFRRVGYTGDNGVFYVISDQVKSTSVFVNQDGTVNSRNYYYPYGGNRGGGAFSDLTTKRYTGQYNEQGLPGGEGLSYYNARWYDSALGRFIQPDTIVPELGNPQALNRYAYALNNPLKYIDPTGHRWVPPSIPIPPFYPIIRILEDWGLLNPMAPYYLVPTALGVREKQRAAATEKQVSEALVLTADWYFEQGEDVREFGPDSQITHALIQDDGVARARQVYMQEGNRDMLGQNSHEYRFGLRDAVREFQDVVKRRDWSTSFLGGYDVQIKTVSMEARHTIAEFTVTNETGWQSATRIWGFSFRQNERRSDPGPGGTMTQHYRWLERVPRRTSPSPRGILAQ